MRKIQEKYDVAVIGGGPAGMMAAGRAAELGRKVILIDRKATLGQKLLMTGNGRCNLTNAKPNNKGFIEKLGRSGPWFFSALGAFGPKDIIEFFEKRGIKTKREDDDRVFPVSDKASEILESLQKYLKENKVKVMLGQEVLGFEQKNGLIEGINLHGRHIYADTYILATGGKSYPHTGSTGDGYKWAGELGHRIIDPYPALVSVVSRDEWVRELAGIALSGIKIGVFQDKKKIASTVGEILFTHTGLSGPAILNFSKRIGELLPGGKIHFEMDLFPALDQGRLDKTLREDFTVHSNKIFKNYLPESLPQKLMNVIIGFSGVNPQTKLNSISHEQRKYLASLLKSIKVNVDGLGGFSQAIITAGGVDLDQIDPKTMRSKKIKNLFFAGEIIDLDGPTGGYNLQICWSTGRRAGEGAAGALS